MSAPDPSESRALTALSELVRDSVRRPSSGELDRGLYALRARLTAGAWGREGVRRWSLVLATVSVCAVLAVLGARFFRADSKAPEQPVALRAIEGGRLLDGGYLAESGNAGIKLFFDEGSQFVLLPGTRGRLRSVDAKGAHLAIEHGSASLRITHRREHRWSIEAGPFLVTVKGTDFTVSWDPTSESFELKLRRGRVTVSGPVVGDGLALLPGQKVTVSLPKAETVITEERFDAPADGSVRNPVPAASVSQALLPSEPGLTRGPPALPSTSATVATERRWREALSNGEWDRILADAERDGIDATLQTASSDDLFALADAARYRRRADLARTTLLAQRRRFPSSPRSLDAIFLLGRVEELRASGRTPAIQWYDEYLARAPAGAYAAEALGRKMILTKEVGGTASARAIAEEYLRRFPQGSYAGAARALLRIP